MKWGEREGAQEEKVQGPLYLAAAAVVILTSSLLWVQVGTSFFTQRTGKASGDIQQVALRINCGGCGKPCTSGCPKCPDKLEGAVLKLAGVQRATFTAGYAEGNGTIRYDASAVSLATIDSTIKQTPPYPGCCTGIALLSQTRV